MIKLLFVCHGNICRSPMAEFVMKSLVRKDGQISQFLIESGATTRDEIDEDGIGHDLDPRAKAVLNRHGIVWQSRQSHQITAASGRQFDYLLGMDHENCVEIRHIIGHGGHAKVVKLLSFIPSDRDIADPWYTDDFETAFSDIRLGCRCLYQRLMSY